MKLTQLTKCTFIFGLIICPVVWSCSKNNTGNPNTLPTPTETGADVMACYLDSATWVINNNEQVTGQFNFGQGTNDTFSIGGWPLPGKTHFLAIHFLQLIIFNHFQVGVPYAANDSLHILFEYSPDSTCQGAIRDVPNLTANSGTVTVTKFDYNNRIISGVFNAKFAIPGCDTVTLKDGWFDFKF